jgi:hypothetical protein
MALEKDARNLQSSSSCARIVKTMEAEIAQVKKVAAIRQRVLKK